MNSTRDKDTQWQASMAGDGPQAVMERPEEVIEKIHQQATHLGPVMEEILRAAHGRGQNHWGLNE
ncbi:MAG TPA: hypothetical protein VFY06_04155 [Verrucomicrobiae bacterium]|nr:hypothetical protein [Verrucomicrobiae bacterium]